MQNYNFTIIENEKKESKIHKKLEKLNIEEYECAECHDYLGSHKIYQTQFRFISTKEIFNDIINYVCDKLKLNICECSEIN